MLCSTIKIASKEKTNIESAYATFTRNRNAEI